MRHAIFVDRDGVINEPVADPMSGHPESPLAVADVTLVDGAATALNSLARDGWVLVGVSNQPAAAKAVAEVSEIMDVQQRVLEMLEDQGVHFDAFRLCLHHPEGVVPNLAGPCDCRKPAPGLLLAAADQLDLDLSASWMIGDTDADVLAGHAAGCRTILVEHSGTGHKRSGAAKPDVAVRDLKAAAAFIQDRDRVD